MLHMSELVSLGVCGLLGAVIIGRKDLRYLWVSAVKTRYILHSVSAAPQEMQGSICEGTKRL